MSAYQKEIEKEHAQEAYYRKKWAEDQEIQRRFFDDQTKFLENMNENARDNFHARLHKAQNEAFMSIVAQEAKKINKTPLEGAHKVFSYVYPAHLTQSGLPISGGAPMPRMRTKRPKGTVTAARQPQAQATM